jgi:alpha-glucosidase (family GH31 glycosyl hydrolase)
MSVNVPFLACSGGFALFFENTWPSYFDLGMSDPGKMAYLCQGGELSYFFFLAESIEKQIRDFTWLTGRQPLPPRWALGYIQSKYGYRNETEARSMVQTMRQKSIPCDAIVLDLYWFENMGDLAWNFETFPGPFLMMSDFLDHGMKTVVITEPYVVESSVNFQEAVDNGYFATGGSGQPAFLENFWFGNSRAGLVDFSKPEAAAWWWDKHPAFFGQELAGIWTDLGEPETHPEHWNHCLGPAEKVHNIYNLLWAEAVFRGFSDFRPDERFFNLTRSGFAGIQRYGVLPWSGDVSAAFTALEAQIPMLLNMGMSGLAYFHSDIGGFTRTVWVENMAELYTRWMQFGAFSPVMRAHGHDSFPQEPWGYGPEAEAICKTFIELRYQLLPYNYALCFENYAGGMPLVRPLFFADPDDPALYDASGDYLWGDAILVSPVVTPCALSKSVRFPEGEWVDFWTDSVYSGPAIRTVPAPLERMPLFVRNGSVLPMAPVMQHTDEHPLDTLFLRIYPSEDREARFVLYEDDGRTLAYQQGHFSLTEFTARLADPGSGPVLTVNMGAAQGSFGGGLERRVYICQVHRMAGSPAVVRVNGEEAEPRSSLAALRTEGTGYFYDSASYRIYVQVPAFTHVSSQVDIEDVQLTGVEQQKYMPGTWAMEQNYPNPFNSSTVISYSIAEPARVILSLYDLLGRKVMVLTDVVQAAGTHSVLLPRGDLPSGIYFYRIQAGDFSDTRKMVIIR